MSSNDLYRQRAIECYLLAERLSDPEQRMRMRLLGLGWLHLLELATKNLLRGGLRPDIRGGSNGHRGPLHPPGGAEHRLHRAPER
jgi:hypothetical protein